MASVTNQADSNKAMLRTLDKGLTVFEELALAGRRGLTVAELERRLGIHRVTLNRFIQTFGRRGYVEQVEGSDGYRLGLKALSLNFASIAGLALRDVGAPLLEELWRTVGETVHLVMMDGGEVVTIDRLEAEQSLTLRTQIGARRSAYCTASGKAIMAHLPENLVDAILARGMPSIAPNTITDPFIYKQQLQQVRGHGYALDDQELAEGIRCAAAPVFDFSGRVVGAVSLSAPCVRVNMEQLVKLALAVAATARHLSRQLGYRPYGGDDAR